MSGRRTGEGAKPRCYVACPHGFTEAGRRYHADVVLPALRGVVEPVDPWELTHASEFAAAGSRGALREFVVEVGRRNARAIQGCDLLAAFLDGQEVDAGTAAEVGYAAALGVPCAGLRTDLRSAGEEGAHVNLQVQAFIEMSGGRIAGTLDELVALLGGLAGGPR
jgi:nucleoside 2-deoxyribosyltransferase